MPIGNGIPKELTVSNMTQAFILTDRFRSPRFEIRKRFSSFVIEVGTAVLQTVASQTISWITDNKLDDYCYPDGW